MMFSSKHKLSKEAAADALSVSKDEVKNKLAELSDMSKQVEASFQEAVTVSREAVEKLTAPKSGRKKKHSFNVAI
jgi:hypothetical protein